MNQHLGPTYALSVLVIVAFAVMFHGADRLPDRPVEAGKSVPGSPPARAATATARRLVADRNQSHRVEDAPARRSAEPPPRAVAESSALPAAVRTVARKTAVKGAFTRVESGESLADVAIRVYGSGQMASALWRANRDQLPGPTSRLEPGMILRTP
jgi:Tfp pilus assembly protein FimV